MHEFRDFQSEQYKAWRLRVFKRDFFHCRLCGGSYHLQAHHIKRWADCIELRFVVSNGITLCETCHATVKDREESYEQMFTKLVGQRPTIKNKKKTRDIILEIKKRLRQ